MAAGSGSTRIFVVAGVLSFIAGCWMGQGSVTTGQPFCVVTPATAAQHPGIAPGQLTEMPSGGCAPGESKVCGRFEGEGDQHQQQFVSDKCGGN